MRYKWLFILIVIFCLNPCFVVKSEKVSTSSLRIKVSDIEFIVERFKKDSENKPKSLDDFLEIDESMQEAEELINKLDVELKIVKSRFKKARKNLVSKIKNNRHYKKIQKERKLLSKAKEILKHVKEEIGYSKFTKRTFDSRSEIKFLNKYYTSSDGSKRKVIDIAKDSSLLKVLNIAIKIKIFNKDGKKLKKEIEEFFKFVKKLKKKLNLE